MTTFNQADSSLNLTQKQLGQMLPLMHLDEYVVTDYPGQAQAVVKMSPHFKRQLDDGMLLETLPFHRWPTLIELAYAYEQDNVMRSLLDGPGQTVE